MTEQLVQSLALINQMILKALDCSDRKSLAFLMVNDTCQVVNYNRATLWDIELYKPTALAVSGQSSIKKDSEIIQETEKKVHKIHEKENIQTFFPEDNSKSSIIWIPISINRRTTLGLMLERWDGGEWTEQEKKILQNLAQGYGHAWKGLYPQWTLSALQKVPWLAATLVGLLIISIVPVPLRVTAPCEVVAKDPFLVTAPLDGIIQEIVVNPGDIVEKGLLLFSYDKRVPLQELEVAQKQFEIADSQLNRSMTQGLSEREALEDVAVWKLKREREKIHLDYLQLRSNDLEVKAAVNGVTVFDTPDEWRGRRVMTGEKIMMISDPEQTKIRIWLPESDNIVIVPEKPIKVFLNIDPITSYEAHLVYVSDYSVVSDKGVVSFTAEADWTEQPKNVKLGLKGTAILYGQNVPLIYWLLRKPISTIRNIFEV
ncbi:MAG: HlyD family efflux transporter periplasmic adaptor subunit [Chlamydiota bacterium]